MNERVTVVSIFNKKDIDKLNTYINVIDNKSLCKVPFGKNVNDRIAMDTLPYHFTLSAWDINQKEFVLERLSKIKFNKFKILINDLRIMNGKENSYVLYFNIEKNDKLEVLHRNIYNILPTEKYNPNSFQFHITITIDKDYEKIMEIKNKLETKFVPFELIVDNIGLFEIYPAELVKNIYANNV